MTIRLTALVRHNLPAAQWLAFPALALWTGALLAWRQRPLPVS